MKKNIQKINISKSHNIQVGDISFSEIKEMKNESESIVDKGINYFKDLVSRNELSKALLDIKNVLKDEVALNEVLILTSRFNSLCEANRKGIINFESKEVEMNKIRDSFISLIDKYHIDLE